MGKAINYKIGRASFDETMLEVVLDIYSTVSLIIPENLIINSVAETLKVSRKKVLDILNEMGMVLMDTFTFTMLETINGNIPEDTLDRVIDFSIKLLQKNLLKLNASKNAVAYKYSINYATIISQINTYRRIAEIEKEIGARVNRKKYEEMRKYWIVELSKVLKRTKILEERRISRKPLNIEDIVGIIKKYIIDEKEAEIEP